MSQVKTHLSDFINVATMEGSMNRQENFNFEATLSKEEYFELTNTCCLCGSVLKFESLTNFVRNEVIEKSCCASCNIQHIEQTHRLQ